MKTVFRIARLELSTLFYSPVAWLVLIIFTVQSGTYVFDLLQGLQAGQYRGQELGSITQNIFADPRAGIFTSVLQKLYLYIPLLTMGLISRELSSGSLKLLLSSPVSLRQIIIGKYVAMLFCGALMIILLSIFVILVFFSIQSMDAGLVASGLLGIYLVICAYSAIGLFLSSLTSHQVIAAVCTLVVFAALNYMSNIWQEKDFFRDITYFLSISGRAEALINGLLTSRDLFYFLSIIVLFLSFTLLQLSGSRERTSWPVKISRYAGVTSIVLFIGYFTDKPRFTIYYDATATKSQTLTHTTRNIIKKIGEPVTINTYVNLVAEDYYFGLPAQRNQDQRFFDRYFRFMPDLTINYIYYYDTTADNRLYGYNPGLNTLQIAKYSAKSTRLGFHRLLPPAEIRKQFNVHKEEGRFVRELVAGNRKSYLRIFNDIFRVPFEPEIAAALKRLTTAAPKIIFVTGNNARSPLSIADQHYRLSTAELTSRSALANRGFDIVALSLDTANIPGDISALVIAGPTTPLSAPVLHKIKNYIDNGGNLLIAAEPGSQHVVDPIISSLGVKCVNGKLYASSNELAPDIIRANFSKASTVLDSSIQSHINDSGVVTMPGAVGLTFHNNNNNNSFTVHPLLVTNDQHTDTSVCVALALARKTKDREQRIIITGDADFLSNKELSRYNLRTENAALTTLIYAWFSYGEFPVRIDEEPSADNKIHLTKTGIRLSRIIFLGILPGLIALSGIILLFRRMRK